MAGREEMAPEVRLLRGFRLPRGRRFMSICLIIGGGGGDSAWIPRSPPHPLLYPPTPPAEETA